MNSAEGVKDQRESGKVVPTKISREAWRTAMAIDGEIATLFSEYGLIRVEGESKMTIAIARMVQLSINEYCDRKYPQ